MSEPSSLPASPKWRRRADARPAEIVQAAYEVFAEKGFAAAKLDDIAKRAGVSKGALYLYFETKQDIFEAVVTDAVAPNIGAIEQFALGFPGPFEQLIRMMVPRVAEMADRTGMGKVIKMVIGESGNFPEIARIWHDDVIAKVLEAASGRGAEFAEVYEPFVKGRGASSTMPQKRNPISSELMLAAAKAVQEARAAGGNRSHLAGGKAA